MKRCIGAYLTAAVVISSPCAAAECKQDPTESTTPATTTPFTSFTGKVTSSKVRLRLQPNLESGIVKELCKDQLLKVTGQEGDFYAVSPTTGQKAYVFRTFILDGKVEGSRVNVRLAPDLDAPVIAQLNSGDPAEGTICAENSKWIEIEPPSTVAFYVSSDFIQNVGDADYITRVQQREQEAKRLLKGAELTAEAELRKPFDEISIRTVSAKFDDIIKQCADCPEYAEKAKCAQEELHKKYTEKRIAYLEEKAHGNDLRVRTALAATENIDGDVEACLRRLEELENEALGSNPGSASGSGLASYQSRSLPTFSTDMGKARDGVWEPIEESLYSSWATGDNAGRSIYDFYDEQRVESTTLTGLVEPYTRPVKNKPGDYLLLDPTSRMPKAYLYSTSVDLSRSVGRVVTVEGATRSCNNFAYPAFYALSIREG